MARRAVPIGVLCLVLVGGAAPTRGDAASGDHAITIEDYFTLGVINDVAMSPDGKQAAYTEVRWEPPAEKRNTDLWVVEYKTHRVRRLTFDSAADLSPQWSPDGKWVYFLSARNTSGEKEPPHDGKRQVWRVGADGGSGPMAVTRVAGGVQQFDLGRDGSKLYYTVAKRHVDEEWGDLRNRYEDLEYGHGVVKFSQVWRLDLQSWRAEKLVEDQRVIVSFAVSPSEKRIAMITTPTEALISFEGWSRVDVWDADTGRVTALPDKMWRADGPSPYGWIESPCWDYSARKLAFRVDWDGYPSEVFVANFKGSVPVMQRVTRPGGVSISPEPLVWRGKSDDLCFIGEERARARVFCIANLRNGKQGPTRPLTTGDVVCEAFSFGRGGRVLGLVMSDVTHGPDVFGMPFGGDTATYERLTDVNPQVADWRLPQIRTVKWKSPDGTEVEGILELPADHDGRERLPLIVEIHGGPTAASLLRMRFWIYGRVLMASKGYAVLSPNYRGSTGYGDKFMTDLIGHKNDRDVADILSGVDMLIEQGIADPTRMGVMGWSNGGYLTNCIIANTDRFKAASSGAGISDVAMQWSIEDTPGHVVNFQGGFPWSRSQEMRDASPLFAADRVKTPTLFHVGGEDERCPPAHQRAMYRALHQYLKVPTELIVYPGEPHGLTTYTNRKAKMEWDQAWFDRYVLGKESEKRPPSN